MKFRKKPVVVPEKNEQGKRHQDLRDCFRALSKYGTEIDAILAKAGVSWKARQQVQDAVCELMEASP